jgi:predicted amidohydrolase
VLNIGLVQLDVKEGDIEWNKIKIENYVKNKTSKGLDLLCFPELCISGYDFEVARNSLDELDFFSKISKKYNQAILAGVSKKENGDYFDTLCIWDEEGIVLGEYKKIHLWGEERKFFTAGKDVVMVNFKGWKVGLLICADYGFAELSRELTLKGAEVIFNSSAWDVNAGELFRLCAKIRAVENQNYSVALNRGSSINKYCGSTGVYGPDGVVVKEIRHKGEDYLEVTLRKGEIESYRKVLPWLEMRRPDVYTKFKN